MDLQLSGKSAVVTGASKGIGLAVAQALVAEGAQVTAGARAGSPELSELVATGSAIEVMGDLTSDAGAHRLIDAAVETYGGVDILVNNVGGVRPRTDGFLNVSDAEWQWSLDVNLLAAVRATRAALPQLLVRAPSTIVTISSVNATLADQGVIDYSAAKAALTNFCKSLSKEFGPKGVRVNTISPGPVDTALWLGSGGVAETFGRANAVDPATIAAGAVADTATGRFTHPAEVADLVVLLASSRAGNLTGADIRIDGGLVTTT
jgi:NAD(P)-dependent dehydrogenase (short-subunit alcohol dehydrogenase family)